MNFQPHSELNNPKRESERERALEELDCRANFGCHASHSLSAVQAPSTIHRPPCKLCPSFVVRCASSLHHPLSPVQVACTVPLLFLPHSLSFLLTNQGQIFNCMSPTYNPPPTPAIAAAFRLNHRSRRPKPQPRYRFSRSCHRYYPSLSLKPSFSTSLTTGVPSEEGPIFFFFFDIFVSFVFIYWDFLE